jgi:hypothetical protein
MLNVCGRLAKFMSNVISYYDDTDSRKTINDLFLIINNINIRHYGMPETCGTVPKFASPILSVLRNED